MPTIDLNSDLAEGYGAYRCGDDDAMLKIVTSANVACGFHAGDPEIMAKTFRTAKARNIVVTNTPEVLSFATAECAFTLMLMAARRAGEGGADCPRRHMERLGAHPAPGRDTGA